MPVPLKPIPVNPPPVTPTPAIRPKELPSGSNKPRPTEPITPEPANFERLAEVFDSLGTTDIKGKRWVVVSDGPKNAPLKWHGWVIEEDNNKLVFLYWRGSKHTFRKPAVGEKRPVVDENQRWRYKSRLYPDPNDAVAWKVRPEEFVASSTTLLDNLRPKEKDYREMEQAGFDKMSVEASRRHAPIHHAKQIARFAHYAHQLGHVSYAKDLHDQTRDVRRTCLDSEIPLHVFVANQIGKMLRLSAVNDANNGDSRQSVQRQWKEIAAIPSYEHRDEAEAMIRFYQSLIDEDAQWVEPDEAGPAKMSTNEEVAYWIYHLRDCNAEQMNFPGSCSVFGCKHLRVTTAGPQFDEPCPVFELRRLGMAAIPQLIEHLDDQRPTRCKGSWRWLSSEGHHLLTYSDACRQIIERITREDIGPEDSGMWHIDDKEEGKQLRKKAEKWWETYQHSPSTKRDQMREFDRKWGLIPEG